MLRLTGLRLPLNHDEFSLRTAICAAFGVDLGALKSYSVFRRAYDARKKSDITLVYTIDADVEGAIGEPTPDTNYKFPEKPKAAPKRRPVVIGTGPCGIFAALIFGADGGLTL